MPKRLSRSSPQQNPGLSVPHIPRNPTHSRSRSSSFLLYSSRHTSLRLRARSSSPVLSRSGGAPGSRRSAARGAGLVEYSRRSPAAEETMSIASKSSKGSATGRFLFPRMHFS